MPVHGVQGDLVRAVAYSLSGEDVGAQTGLERVAVSELQHRLAGLGLDASTLANRRQLRMSEEQPWPYPVPERLREGVPAAQLQALCSETIEAMRLRTHQIASGSARLTPAEKRLIADRPPHW